jgi:hypothetical protein
MNYFEKNRSFLLTYFSYWENRKQYLELMERFIHGKIDGRQFDREFSKMRNVDTDKLWRVDRELSGKEFVDKINDLELTKSHRFSHLINELFTDCDVFQPDPILRDDYEISEEELRNRVKKTLLQIKEYL